MSAAKENGKESIHPETFIDHEYRVPFQTGGLTKREYMATEIAAGFCADHSMPPEKIPAEAVRLVDALLEELQK